MVTSLYTGFIKLNKEDKDYTKYLIVANEEEGVLLVNKGLFVISFDNFAHLYRDTIFKDIKHIGDITL